MIPLSHGLRIRAAGNHEQDAGTFYPEHQRLLWTVNLFALAGNTAQREIPFQRVPRCDSRPANLQPHPLAHALGNPPLPAEMKHGASSRVAGANGPAPPRFAVSPQAAA